jgi:hypothetical protein
MLMPRVSWGNRSRASTPLLSSRLNRFHQEGIMGVFIGLDVSLSKTVVDRDGAVLY